MRATLSARIERVRSERLNTVHNRSVMRTRYGLWTRAKLRTRFVHNRVVWTPDTRITQR